MSRRKIHICDLYQLPADGYYVRLKTDASKKCLFIACKRYAAKLSRCGTGRSQNQMGSQAARKKADISDLRHQCTPRMKLSRKPDCI